ncbi:MAG: SPOR domain-containing protein [Aestuariivirga sp.]|uniref:SPOR domain-containing protein n=1 Tax=Aestuariivirga sp. TaxID=2650926 RepID=UPI0038CF4657
MRTRSLFLATVCSAFLAASAAASGTFAATSDTELVTAAYQALQAGDIETAIAGFSKAIESRGLAPGVLANTLLNRAHAYQRMNEHQLAIDDYTAALRIDAMSGEVRALALYNRGLSYQRLQNNTLAMEDFTSALFLNGQFSHAYYSRGMLLRDAGQYLFALADFDKALRYNYPDPARVHVAEAMVFEKLQRLPDARAALEKALAAKPDYEPAQRRLAALDGVPAPAVAGDEIQTAAVSPAPDGLPAAQAPSEALMVEEPAAAQGSAKQFSDRVPSGEAAAPAAAPATETVIAVETVPEEPSAPAAQVEVAAAGPAPAEEPPPPKLTGWTVQLASATSEDGAWSSWKKMQGRYKVLAGKEPVVVRADLGAKGVFYRVRLVGFDSQSEAGSACARLKAKGVKCFVSKAAS